MYSTCIHCHGALGSNESIEAFPTGRRLAFDGAKGRLWVVCSRCRRWNLTPLEERWEAIEDCERQFSGTRLRASTDNIGLARLGSGLELIRIGTPQRPEIAAWRYAPAIRKRWLMYGMPGMAIAGAWSMAQIGAPIVGWGMTFGGLGAATAMLFLASWRQQHARAALPNGRIVRLGIMKGRAVSLVPVDSGWGVRGLDRDEVLTGPYAVHGLRAVMTMRNFSGADQATIDDALKLLVASQTSERFIVRLAGIVKRRAMTTLPRDISIALEMALHDDVERRALDGELELLDAEWKMAEEIAGIADNLLLAPNVMPSDPAEPS